jgi:hypothetical protein
VLVIIDFDDLTEGTTINRLYDLIPVSNMIPNLILVELTKLYAKSTHRHSHAPQ